MSDGAIARRYARALVEIGVDLRIVERIADDLHRFDTLMNQDDGALRGVMINPGLTGDERRGVLDQVIPRLDLHPMVANFLRLLLDKRRLNHFDGIFRVYGEMADERAGRVRATVTTAGPISGVLADDVRRGLAESTGKQVIVTFETDPSIIGGMIAQVGDKVIDASVSARLDLMKKALLKDPLAAVGEA